MLHTCRRSGSILAFCLLLLLFPGHLAVTFAAGPERIIPNPRDQQRIQEIVNEFMAKLTMRHEVAVAVVPKNPLMVSVEPDVSTGFLLSVEEDFISELTQEELEAAIAHELGHVWIFTHHPFLQTELLANQIAQRLVPRSSLVQVYEKVWKRQGTKGDLARFVGD
jgi:Peptidase family M48